MDTTLEALQFSVTDVGSEWVATPLTHTINHNGNQEIIESQIGVKPFKRLAKIKKISRFGANPPKLPKPAGNIGNQPPGNQPGGK